MTSRMALVALTVLVAGSVLSGQRQAPPRQTFRSGAEVVVVDVSVRSDGKAVEELTASDFVLTDNGVRQDVESVEASAVPIDVTLVVDVSGNQHARVGSPEPASVVAAAIESDTKPVLELLRPGDRVRMLAVDTYVGQVRAFQPATAAEPIRDLASGGRASLYDTLAAALVQPAEPARRQVVIARTKGIDTLSSVDAQAVAAIAERSGAVFYLVGMEQTLDEERQLNGFHCREIGLCWPTRRSWVPHERELFGRPPLSLLSRDGAALAAAAEASGGAMRRWTGLREPTLIGTFREAFEDFRRSYVLRYSPRGVSGPGWHAVTVTVPKNRTYSVRARNGYAVEPAVPAPPAVEAPAEARTLAELTAAYGQGAHRTVTASLRRIADPGKLIEAFEAEGNPWPANPRREAAFAVELAEAGIFSPRQETREAALRLLERFARLVRHPLGPDDFERAWFRAVVAMLEGAVRPPAAETLIGSALARFPKEPRFLLARAIVADQRLSAPGRVSSGGAQAPSEAPDVDSARRLYEAALALPEAGPEARVRLAYLLHRYGRHAEAFAHLTEAGPATFTDPVLDYWRLLFLGHVLGATDRPDGAIEAYDRAGAIFPFAQSARVALMNALVRRGDRARAEALAENVLADDSQTLDPWWIYWFGQSRFYQNALARLQELVP